MNLIDELVSLSKKEKIKVYFDMDGTLVAYKSGEKPRIQENEKGFYFNKTPLKTTLKIAKKLSKNKNIEVGIASNCYYAEQHQDKLDWIRRYAPFITQENVIIIELKKENYTSETKPFIKYEKIKQHLKNSLIQAWLIEDDHEIIKAINSKSSNIHAEHISTILK